MTKTNKEGIRLVLTLVMVAVLILLFSPPLFSQDSQPDDGTCLFCHENMAKTLAHTTHRLSSETEKPRVTIACVSCHTGAADHVDDPSAENIGNPATMSVGEGIELCSRCHQPHTEMGTVGFDPHIGQDLACVDCHSVHNANVSLLLDDKAEFCGKCHVAVKNDFRKRSNHPLIGENVTCISCHDFTSEGSPMYGHGLEATCANCHPEIIGPYLYEHEAISTFSTEGDDGCINCHEPHGSVNDRLLVQTGDNLCKQCHGIPPGHLTNHGGVGTLYSCITCHSGVHGSYTNRALLDPNLSTIVVEGPETCFCHGIE